MAPNVDLSANPPPSGRTTAPVWRIAVLWQHMTGYLNACLKALVAIGNVDLALAYAAPDETAPFDESLFQWVTRQYRWQGSPDAGTVRRFLMDSQPDAVFVSSWHISAYRSALHHMGHGSVPRILCMDNQWHGTPKQWLGRLTWRRHIRPLYDRVFVPGDRQAYFARRLGFRTEHIMRGMLSADTPAFTRPVDWPNPRVNRFLYAGRLSAEKGVAVLAEAYTSYRASVEDPWPLVVAGTGPQWDLISNVRGVEMLGFLQPSQLPKTMWGATVAVCPSLFEPWGVVIHEAAAAGLIIICSEAAGAGVHLVQDGYNGFVCPAGDSSDLARAFVTVAKMSEARRGQMSDASVSISRQFSPERWAQYVIEMIQWYT